MNSCPSCHNLLDDGARKCSRCGHASSLEPDYDGVPQSDLTGRVVGNGRYEVKSLLGVGGMGAVYKALDTRLRREVAVKVLNAELFAHPTARRRMTQEAEALARIEHPNVVRVLDVFDEGPMLAMVLEFVTGGDLEAKVKPGGLPEAEVVSLMTGVLAGLEAIHEAGLVHRDMKPANVLLSGKGVPKITDLGVARDSQAKEKTRLGAALGTPEYMSPEQVQGFAVDARSDIYSCGIVMYELLTGRKPYYGTSEFEITSAHVRDPPDLAALEGKVSSGLISVVATALAKAPGDRFETAGAMSESLHEHPGRPEAVIAADPRVSKGGVLVPLGAASAGPFSGASAHLALDPSGLAPPAGATMRALQPGWNHDTGHLPAQQIPVESGTIVGGRWTTGSAVDGAGVPDPPQRATHAQVGGMALLFSLEGRASRGMWWSIGIRFLGIAVLIGLVAGATGGIVVAGLLVSGLTLIASVVSTVKRLHDFGLPGGWTVAVVAGNVLIGLIPGTAGGYALLAASLVQVIGFGCIRGTVGTNRYGPDPLEAR